MKSEVKIVDLTMLRKMTNKIDTDKPTELKIIEFYSYYVTKDNNTIEDFTNYVLSRNYYSENKYPYNELRTFYNTKNFLNIVIRFIGIIDYLVTKTVGTNFENVLFNKIKSDDDKLLVAMRVDYA